MDNFEFRGAAAANHIALNIRNELDKKEEIHEQGLNSLQVCDQNRNIFITYSSVSNFVSLIFVALQACYQNRILS